MKGSVAKKSGGRTRALRRRLSERNHGGSGTLHTFLENLRPCAASSGALVPLPVRLRYATRSCCLTKRMSGEGLRSRLAARFKRFSRSATSTQSPNAPAGRLPSGRFVRRKVHVTVSFRPQMMPKNPPLIRWGGYTHGCLSLHGRLPPAVASACASRRPCWHWPF